jgi:hypothetical protein
MLLILNEGVYQKAGTFSTNLKRFTCYITYDGEVTEEIDVNAVDRTEARAICKKALELDYDPGCKCGEIVERVAGIWYM